MTLEIKRKESECMCEANLFYKRYKDRIEKLFADTFGGGFPAPAPSFISSGEDEDSEYYKSLRRIADEEFARSRALQYGSGRKYSEKYPGRLSDYSHRSGGEEDYGDALNYYQKLFDYHLQFLYTPAESEEDRYFKFPRKSELEYEESLAYTHKEIMYDGPWMSDSQRKAENYLRMHHIYELFHFLGSHLVATISDCVENPIHFLIDLLDKCLKYRCGIMAPPLLFTQKHVESLFDSMDPMLTGVIDVEQYHTGMLTLGIGYYEKFPKLTHKGLVTKKIFVLEALRQQQLHLDIMIQSFAPISICYSIGGSKALTQIGGEEEGYYEYEKSDQ